LSDNCADCHPIRRAIRREQAEPVTRDRVLYARAMSRMLLLLAIAIAIAFEMTPTPMPPRTVVQRERVVITPRTAPRLPSERPAVRADPDPLEPLLPEDAEWVLDAIARTESVRALSNEERRALTAQLVSVRMHAVLERTEPLATDPGDVP
jgi:hypothetical protein